MQESLTYIFSLFFYDFFFTAMTFRILAVEIQFHLVELVSVKIVQTFFFHFLLNYFVNSFSVRGVSLALLERNIMHFIYETMGARK